MAENNVVDSPRKAEPLMPLAPNSSVGAVNNSNNRPPPSPSFNKKKLYVDTSGVVSIMSPQKGVDRVPRTPTSTTSNTNANVIPAPPPYLDSEQKENVGFLGRDDENHRAKIIIAAARKALNYSGGLAPLSRTLQNRIGVLFSNGEKVPGGEDVRNLIISGWIEELLRFLAIKTLAGDTRLPFEMAASIPIDEAWRALMVTPVAYTKVCQALGNETVIDHDPFEIIDDHDFNHRKKHFHCTTRVYALCFDQDPPKLYWPEPKETTHDRFMKIFGSTSSNSASEKKGECQSIYQKWSSLFSNSCRVDQKTIAES